MTIALVAHDSKKELMVQFCTAYRRIFSEHTLISTAATGRVVAEGTGLTIHRFLPGNHGGNEQIVARIACDEVDPDGEIDAMAAKLFYAITHQYQQPANYYGVGGRKIFRDLIWEMQGLMRADHKFYKAHGMYDDFPQKHWPKMCAMYLVGAMLANPKLKAKMGGKMTEGMLMPYQNVLNKAQAAMQKGQKL